MDNFTCKSCGATMYINEGDKPVCAYCKSHLVKKIDLKPSLFKRYFFVILLLLSIALIAYVLVQKDATPQTIDPKTITKQVSSTPTIIAKDIPVEKMAASYIEPSKLAEIEAKMTPWMPRDKYSKLYNNAYFKQHKSYPIYTQTNADGDIRVLIVKKEISHWRYAAYMDLEDLKQMDAKHRAKGYKMLSLYTLDQDYFKIYAASWVRKNNWNKEAARLLSLGIHPPDSL